MHFILSAFLLFLSSYVLAAPCGFSFASKNIKELTNVNTAQCKQVVSSKSCQSVYQSIKQSGQDPRSKALSCDAGSMSANKYETSYDYISGCAAGGWNFLKDSFVDVGTLIGEGTAKIILDIEAEKTANALCDKDRNIKRNIYIGYNRSMPKLMQLPAPSEQQLATMSCASVKSKLKQQRIEKANSVGSKITSKLLSGNTELTADEKEFRAWGQSIGAPNKSAINLVAAAKARLKELGVKLECYNPAAASALVCESIAEVASVAVPTGYSVFKLSKLKNISKIAGVEVSATRVAAGARIAGVDLKRAAQLNEAERISEAEKAIGRTLNKDQRRSLLLAHEVGAGTGRGYLSYTTTDLKRKATILSKGGFTQAERDKVMRLGLAGANSDPAIAKTYANKQRLLAEQNVLDGKLAEAKSKYLDSADSYDVYLKDPKALKNSRDYWVGSKLNVNAARYDKASTYFIQSFGAERNTSIKTEAIFESLRREKAELRVIITRNPKNSTARYNYENHLKLIEAVVKNPQIRFSESAKAELLRP